MPCSNGEREKGCLRLDRIACHYLIIKDSEHWYLIPGLPLNLTRLGQQSSVKVFCIRDEGRKVELPLKVIGL